MGLPSKVITSIDSPKLNSFYQSDTPPVVIFPVSHAVAFSVIRALQDEKVPVLALDFKKRAAGLWSNKVTPMLLEDMYDSPEVFSETLLRLGSKFSSKPVLFCVDDEDLFLTLKQREEFEKYYRLPISNWDVVENIVNKKMLYRTIQDHDLPCPKTWFCEELQDLEAQKNEITFPCILKPTFSTAFRQTFQEKARKFDEFPSLYEYAAQVKNSEIEFIVQEFIDGGADQLFTYAAYSKADGTVVGGVTGKKVHQFPPDFGTCRLGEVVQLPELEELSKKILKLFKYHGISLGEYKRDSNGAFRLIEINTRPGDWPERCAQLSGVNIVKMAYDDAIGLTPQPKSAHYSKIKWANLAEDFYYCVRGYRLLGYQDEHRGFWRWLKDIQGLKSDAFFDWSDPKPFMVRLIDMAKDFWKREKSLSEKSID